MWRRLLLLLIGVLFVLSTIVIVRTLLFVPTQSDIHTEPLPNIDHGPITSLSRAIQIETVSPAVSPLQQRKNYSDLHQLLEHSYPRAHKVFIKETINNYSLLYTWKGSSSNKKPILLLAHQDVVPIEDGTEQDWRYPPFSGEVAEGYIWGRGAWDDKGNLFAFMAAIEVLIKSGFQPERTVMLAFGHDEEIGGQQGAKAIAKVLEQRGLDFEFILDEGTFIGKGLIPDITKPVAMIGIAEKGYLNLSLTATDSGGHSSIPSALTAVGRLSRAVYRLQAQKLPMRLGKPAQAMMRTLGPLMPFSQRLVLANLWLFEPLLLRSLEQQPYMNAYIRTTIAPTLLSAGVKENVLPQSARAVINFRILPGQTVEQVIRQVTAIIDDPKVEVSRYGEVSSEPSSISSMEGFGYQQLSLAIQQVFPDTIIVPSLLFAATDSRHYAQLTEQILRFTPITIGPDDVKRIHGTDERIALEDYKNAIRFYYQLIKNTAIVHQQ